MPDRPQHPTSLGLKSQRPLAPVETCLTAEQVARWADVIAEGRDDFPEDLSSPSRVLLLAAVRERLRRRLVRHIARAIAARLRLKGQSDKEDRIDD